jgi:hypothetical protein
MTIRFHWVLLANIAILFVVKRKRLRTDAIRLSYARVDLGTINTTKGNATSLLS